MGWTATPPSPSSKCKPDMPRCLADGHGTPGSIVAPLYSLPQKESIDKVTGEQSDSPFGRATLRNFRIAEADFAAIQAAVLEALNIRRP